MSGPSDKRIVTEAAESHGIRPDVLWGLYGTETSFGRNVSRSSAGAVGPFQFLPSTARSLGVNPYDFRSAAFGAAKYLAQFKSRGLGGMLSAYNAGPGGGYQKGYVETTLRNARTFGGAKGMPVGEGGEGGGGGTRTAILEGEPPASSGALQALIGALSAQQPQSSVEGLSLPKPTEPRGEGPRVPRDLSQQQEPVVSPAVLAALDGLRPEEGGAEQQVTLGTGGGEGGGGGRGGSLTGLLPAGASIGVRRTDKGKDLQLKPGEPIMANGRYEVVAVPSDPSGFGPAYPVVKFLSGPDAGHTIYFGHVDAHVHPGQRGGAGDVLATTSRTGHNAPPGWVEIGLWGPNGPLQQGGDSEGAAGRAIARLLRVG